MWARTAFNKIVSIFIAAEQGFLVGIVLMGKELKAGWNKNRSKTKEPLSMPMPNPKQSIDQSAIRFTIKEIIMMVTAVLINFAQIIVESQTIAAIFLIAISGLLFLYVCRYHPTSVLNRMIWAGIIVVVFSAMIIYVYDRGLERKRDDLKKQREDAQSGLHAIVSLPPSRINSDSTFTILNDSHQVIGSHMVFCEIIEANSPHTHFSRSGRSTASPSSSVLESGGDAETSGCLKDLYGNRAFTLAGGDTHLTCMDILVGVTYSLVDQPNAVDTKEFRFISQDDNGGEWLRLRLGTEVSPCHVRY
jgi:hypothetical protein